MSHVFTLDLGSAGESTLLATIVSDNGYRCTLAIREEDGGLETLGSGEADTYDEALRDAAWRHALRCEIQDCDDRRDIVEAVIARAKPYGSALAPEVKS